MSEREPQLLGHLPLLEHHSDSKNTEKMAMWNCL